MKTKLGPSCGQVKRHKKSGSKPDADTTLSSDCLTQIINFYYLAGHIHIFYVTYIWQQWVVIALLHFNGLLAYTSNKVLTSVDPSPTSPVHRVRRVALPCIKIFLAHIFCELCNRLKCLDFDTRLKYLSFAIISPLANTVFHVYKCPAASHQCRDIYVADMKDTYMVTVCSDWRHWISLFLCVKNPHQADLTL